MIKNTKTLAMKLLPIAALVIGASALTGCSKKEEALESYYDAYLTEKMRWQIGDDETIYLALHIQRMTASAVTPTLDPR